MNKLNSITPLFNKISNSNVAIIFAVLFILSSVLFSTPAGMLLIIMSTGFLITIINKILRRKILKFGVVFITTLAVLAISFYGFFEFKTPLFLPFILHSMFLSVNLIGYYAYNAFQNSKPQQF